MSGIAGFQDISDTGGELNAQAFIVNQLISKLATTALVKVLAVTNSGGVSAVGFVDVQPMVHQVDGEGNPTPHGRISHIPYFRLQGGSDAVIIDPKVGDVGFCVFCSRDISAVKRQKAPAAPGSRRRYGWADGLYVGGVLNGVPTQYLRYSETGVDLVTPHNLTITANNVTLDTSGNLAVKGEVTAKVGANQVTLTQHRNTGVQTGSSLSGIPTPGS